jgi:hypothetical protein
MVAIPFVLTRTPESLGRRARLDLAGIALVAAAAFATTWALIGGNDAGWTSVATLLPLAVGLAAGVTFVAVERRSSAPMLPPRLFRSRAFAGGNLSIFFLNATLTGAIFLTAQFFQVAAEQGPLGAGLRLVPWGILPVLIGPRAGALADRFGERALVVAGTLAVALGVAGMAGAVAVAGPGVGYGWLAGAMAVSGAGLGLAIPATTRAAVSRVAPAELGTASGTYSTLRQLGGAFGVAILGATFAAFAAPGGAAGSGGAGVSGGFAAATAFADGYLPALAVAAVFALAASAAGLALPRAASPSRVFSIRRMSASGGQVARPRRTAV